ncbi:MAG: hypothetical protein JJT77_02685 [Crocinitomicaceae bacterium]|nr:hypothetical protein [Crocinitomicaceae bacterium]
MKNTNYKLFFFSTLASLLLISCSTYEPILVTDNPGMKVGIAEESTFFFGLLRPMHMDLSIQRAVYNGQITMISSVDRQIERKLFKTTHRTIVTGE